VDGTDPVFANTPDFTKRPVLLDRLDWIDGWPVLRAGLGPSDERQKAPAAQPDSNNKSKDKAPKPLRLGKLLPAFSDDFNGAALDTSRWSWVRPPAASSYAVANGAFRFDTQAADLFEGDNTASVLTEAAPQGDYIVEARVHLNLPAEGCCFNYVQAGILIYGGDDTYVRLMHFSNWETRQIEFGKEFFDPRLEPAPGRAHFGGTLLGPPAETTYLRILKRTVGGQELYTAYSSRDGETWVRGGTWAHSLGSGARIGLASMGGGGFTANFDYVRVYAYKEGL
jgi:arabinan endo-1,5-alpha-L-arabinosidase